MSELVNYKHLRYFWAVAHEGSIANASKALHITPQTISGQLSLLEARLGCELLEKDGRGLTLTPSGITVLKYADEIFKLGQELGDVMRGVAVKGPSELIVGAASALPKTIVCKILEPTLADIADINLTSLEGPIEHMLADLISHKIDLLISDTPAINTDGGNVQNHFLGESGLTFFGVSELKEKYSSGFPESLNGAPMLLPTRQYAIREKFERWAHKQNLFPNVVGQFDDSALIKSFGQKGLGIFFMPSAIADEVCHNFDVEVIGDTNEIKHAFYAISAERKVQHPAVVAVCDVAKRSLFS